jgi:hypothetical protein
MRRLVALCLATAVASVVAGTASAAPPTSRVTVTCVTGFDGTTATYSTQITGYKGNVQSFILTYMSADESTVTVNGIQATGKTSVDEGSVGSTAAIASVVVTINYKGSIASLPRQACTS